MNIIINTILGVFSLAVIEFDYFLMLQKENKKNKKLEFKIRERGKK